MPLACKAIAIVADEMFHCECKAAHPREHEATVTIAVAVGDEERETPFLIWWDDDGHAFVGSNKAVNTGRIGGWDD